MNNLFSKAGYRATDDGYLIHIQDKTIRTPGGHDLLVPAEDLAKAIVAEWRTQGDKIKPETMPMHRFAMTALDRVAPFRTKILEEIAAYGVHDLVCYRAEEPEELVQRETGAWDPLLAWVKEAFGAKLERVQGIDGRGQNAGTVKKLMVPVREMKDFPLTGFHSVVQVSGSLVLPLGLVHGRMSVDECWRISRIEADFQIARWGEDREAAAAAKAARQLLLEAARFMGLSGCTGLAGGGK